MSILSTTNSGIYNMPIDDKFVTEHGFQYETMLSAGDEVWYLYRNTNSELPISLVRSESKTMSRYNDGKKWFFIVSTMRHKIIYERYKNGEIVSRKEVNSIGDFFDAYKFYYEYS